MTYTEQLKEAREYLADADARPTEYHGIVVEVTRQLAAALESLARVEAVVSKAIEETTWGEQNEVCGSIRYECGIQRKCFEAVQKALDGKQ